MSNLALNKIDKDTGEITGTMNLEIRVYPLEEPRGNTKAFASVTVDGMFGVHGLSVIEGKNGLFVSMPQQRDSKGKPRDVFHPVTSEGRAALQDAVLGEYAVSLDAMVAQRESTLQKLRDAAKTAQAKPAPAPGKEQKDKPVKRGGPEH